MYTIEDLGTPLRVVWKEVTKADAPVGFMLGLLTIFLSSVILVLCLALYNFGVVPEPDHDKYWTVCFSIAGALVLYPITFTITYTPIALLLAIPVVVYKHVFKLG